MLVSFSCSSWCDWGATSVRVIIVDFCDVSSAVFLSLAVRAFGGVKYGKREFAAESAC